MSESETSETSETKGRMRREMAADFEGTGFTANKEDWILADAIDRIAADVAAVKASLDGISAEDVRHFIEADKAWVTLVEEQRDSARYALADAQAEAERLRGELAEAKAETQRIQDEADDREQTEKVKRLNAEIEKTHRTLLNRTCERDEAKAEVERLKAVVHSDAGHMAAALTAIKGCRADLDEARAEAERAKSDAGVARMQRDAAIVRRDDAKAEVERLRSELAARPTAGWLTADERSAVAFAAASLRGHAIAGNLKAFADQLDALLARAGSPPVVEVPVLHAGGINEIIHVRYRAALDAAGIAWKEVPCE